jgi:hypothetical protein
MLRYDVKLEYDNLKRDTLVWGEKYIAPDLSFMSGVTSQDYHVDKSDKIAASIGGDTNFSYLNIECENVTRNGYIVIYGKKYKIEEKKATELYPAFKYTYVDGVYYNVKSDATTVTIKNRLKEQWKRVDGKYKADIVEGDVEGTVSGNYLLLDTIVWIEDDHVTIDGNKYIFDRYDEGIKYYPGGRALLPEEVTQCDDIVYNYFENVSEYIYVTKFILTKNLDKRLEFDKLSYCTYFYYVEYKGYYCPVDKDGEKYTCKVPKRLLYDEYKNSLETESFDVTDPSGNLITVSRISQLKTTDAAITINSTLFPVEYILQNSNYGDELAVYLTDDSDNITVGESIVLTYQPEGVYDLFLYRLSDNDEFVMFKNVKYYPEDNIADTVTINNVEYDVSYPNGLENEKDALVNIDGDMIPMKIGIDGDNVTLERYGYVVKNDAAGAAKYTVNKYKGININGKIYRVHTDGENSSTGSEKYIEMSEPVPYEFMVDSIEGSSLLICTPKLSTFEYTDDFIANICPLICELFVDRQDVVKIVSENRAFGTKYINSDTSYLAEDDSTESLSELYDSLNNLVLFVNSGYIQVQLPLTMNVALNGMQDDIVKKEFYTVEKEKAINPIVDMEKDVYVPKYIKGKTYTGSDTDFSPVNSIEVNLHFRTRDMESWKVYDGSNNVAVSGTMDNWFCTDYFPYKEMLEHEESATSVMNTSDLLYLLWFTNDDVFYQRDKIGKSFLRFSYYDSPDPNTQSLLATSTVFMNEHSLYKKYIDNARRNVKDYGLITEKAVENLGDRINKISVSGELLKGKHMKGLTTYELDNIDMVKMVDDSKRLSSRFIIDNKYATDTSAEGFYVYIFREYSENLHPKPIYMKVEFNHAGVGRTIPFIVPMKWQAKENGNQNELFPTEKLSLSRNDIESLKRGYPLSFVYAQTYIPLYAVYDFKNKEYAYVFDDRYATVDENNKLVLNLFELKVATEEYADDDDQELNRDRADVRNNNIRRAVIDVGKQFNDESNSEENQP